MKFSEQNRFSKTAFWAVFPDTLRKLAQAD